MNDYVIRKYQEFIDENGYIPRMFNPYNCKEVQDISPTQTTQCGSTTSTATVLITEEEMNNNDIKLSGAYGRDFGSRGKLQELDGICGTLIAAMGTGGGNVPIIQEEKNERQCNYY